MPAFGFQVASGMFSLLSDGQHRSEAYRPPSELGIDHTKGIVRHVLAQRVSGQLTLSQTVCPEGAFARTLQRLNRLETVCGRLASTPRSGVHCGAAPVETQIA
jgi:hypothetical protein